MDTVARKVARQGLLLIVLAAAGCAPASPAGAGATASRCPAASAACSTPAASQTSPAGNSPAGNSPAGNSPAAADWPAGLPGSIGGLPVLLGDAIDTRIASATDDSPFLIAGYLVFVEVDCYIPPSAPTSPLAGPCPSGWFLQDDPTEPPTLTGHSRHLVVGPNVASSPGTWTMAYINVLRVHVQDGRAATCAPSIAEACRRAIVVDAAVWSGSAAAEPSPTASQ
jgi:hypothetical protein